jgi:hypothetical protein
MISSTMWQVLMRKLFKLAGKTLKRVSVNECNITGSQLSAIMNGVIIGLYKCSGMNKSNPDE